MFACGGLTATMRTLQTLIFKFIMIDFSIYKNLWFHVYDFVEWENSVGQTQHNGYYEIYNIEDNGRKNILYYIYSQNRGVPSSFPDTNVFASSGVSVADINSVLTKILSIDNNVDTSNLDTITDNSLLYKPSSLFSDTRDTIKRYVSDSYIVTYLQSYVDKKVPLSFVPYNLYELPLNDTNIYQTLNGFLQIPSPTISDDEYKIYKLVEDYNKNYILYHSHFDNNDNSSDSSSSVDLSVVNNQLTKIADSLNVTVESDPDNITKSITEVLNDQQQSDLIQVNTTEYPLDFKRQSNNSLDFTE